MAEVPVLPTGKNHLESSLKTEVLLEGGKCYGENTAKKGTRNRNAGVGAAILNRVVRRALWRR